MHKSLLAAALLFAAPLAAQPMPDGHDKMAGMEHGKMAMGDRAMMKNTPANPYAEAAMEMHHKMMVTGADASETWTAR